MDAPQPEEQVEIDLDLFGKFMQQIPIWDHSSISKDSYIALSSFDKEKLIANYYFDRKSRGSGKFDIFYFFYDHYAAAIWVKRSCKINLETGWKQNDARLFLL